jgi:hypothetical protein
MQARTVGRAVVAFIVGLTLTSCGESVTITPAPSTTVTTSAPSVTSTLSGTLTGPNYVLVTVHQPRRGPTNESSNFEPRLVSICRDMFVGLAGGSDLKTCTLLRFGEPGTADYGPTPIGVLHAGWYIKLGPFPTGNSRDWFRFKVKCTEAQNFGLSVRVAPWDSGGPC